MQTRKRATRTLLCLIAVICLCLGLCMPAHAQDFGYSVTNYTVDATLHENNTISQTESISVEYHEPRHGIFRSMPEIVRVWQTVDGEDVLMLYRIKIKDVKVTDAAGNKIPFEVSSDDDYKTIRIGDEDVTVTGAVDYNISFTYDIGDDRVPDYDELFYSLLGPDWDTTIDNFSFALHFDKPIPAESMDGLSLYSGEFGAEGNDSAIVLDEVTDTLISGYAPDTLAPQEAVTVYTQLPEGYFTGERTIALWPAWLVLAALAALCVYTLLRALTTAQSAPVTTVEFYPPDGVTSAEVGVIVDGSPDDKDLISLVVWLADKGCLTIEEEDAKKRTVLLRKAGPLPAGVPAHVKDFYRALFANGEERHLNDADEAFYNAFTEAKTELGAYFSEKERALYDSGSRTAAFLLPLGCVLLWGLFAFLAACRIELFLGVFVAVAAALLIVCIFVIGGKSDKKFFSSGVSNTLGMLWPCLLVAGAVALGVWLDTNSLMPPLLIAGSAAVTGLCCLLSGRMIKMTTYRLEMSGKLLGLRNFIQNAELPRLKVLLEENPAYFYSVLPYAYVFNLSDKWMKQFETLALEPPTWYRGSDIYGYLWFDASMRRHLDTSHKAVLETESKNSGSGGSSSGGFSGGGFGGGGGGGGSW